MIVELCDVDIRNTKAADLKYAKDRLPLEIFLNGNTSVKFVGHVKRKIVTDFKDLIINGDHLCKLFSLFTC